MLGHEIIELLEASDLQDYINDVLDAVGSAEDDYDTDVDVEDIKNVLSELGVDIIDIKDSDYPDRSDPLKKGQFDNIGPMLDSEDTPAYMKDWTPEEKEEAAAFMDDKMGTSSLKPSEDLETLLAVFDSLPEKQREEFANKIAGRAGTVKGRTSTGNVETNIVRDAISKEPQYNNELAKLISSLKF